MNIKWWGYLHVEGTLHVKRYFDLQDLDEADESPFVELFAGPWECSGKEEALEKLRKAVEKYNGDTEKLP